MKEHSVVGTLCWWLGFVAMICGIISIYKGGDSEVIIALASTAILWLIAEIQVANMYLRDIRDAGGNNEF